MQNYCTIVNHINMIFPLSITHYRITLYKFEVNLKWKQMIQKKYIYNAMYNVSLDAI